MPDRMPSAGWLRHAWLSGLLLATMASSSLLQFGLGVLAPFITVEFGLSRVQYGSAVSALLVSGVVVSLQAGRLVGRWGEVRLLRVLFVLVVVAFTGAALAPGWEWVLVAAVVMGVPLGLGNPVTNQVIVSRVDLSVQGPVLGVKQSGVQVGALFAGTVAAPVAVAYGWRAALVVLALAPVVGLLLSAPLSSGDRARVRASAGGPLGRPPGLALFLSGYAALMGFGASAATAFLPLFAYEELGMAVGRAGQLVGVMGLVGAIARIVLGLFGNRLHRVGRWLAGLAALAIASAGALLVTTQAPVLVWLVAVGLGVSANGWQVPSMLAVVRLGKGAARSTGIVMGGFMTGMMLGPLAFGAVVDATASYQTGWLVIVAAFVAATVLSAVSVPVSRRRQSS